MKKLLVVLTVLCLVFTMAAMAESHPFTFRDGIQFGMTQEEVIAIEGTAPHEVDTEHTRGTVTYTEVEYGDVGDDDVKGEVTYIFSEDKLAAIRVDFGENGNTFEEAEEYLTGIFGEGQELDPSILGDAVYAVDDDGHLEAKVEAWEAEDLIGVLEQDEEGEIEVTFVDMKVD